MVDCLAEVSVALVSWVCVGCSNCFPLQIMSSVSSVDFLQYFAFAFGSEKLVGVDAELQSILTQLDGSPFSKIQALKEFGNSLFRGHQYALAGDCYDQACRQLGVALKDNFDLDLNSILSLAVSLCLNLAACSNKIQAFEGALLLCTMVLTFFPKNAKALFRKAVALRRLNRLSEASVTLKEAQAVEPHNKDIIRELEEVVQALELNHNGKRVIVDTLDDNEVHVGKKCVFSPQAPDIGLVMNMDCAPVCSPVVPMDSMESESSSVHGVPLNDAETLKDEADYLSCSSTSSHFNFTNKKRPHKTLKLSPQDYEKLLHGKNLGFYHPRSMSFLRVRTLTSKTIQTGTPHEDIYGTAEVPTSSPTTESFVQEEIKLVQEEDVFQVDKKTRLTSASFCVSKASLVQFNFTAFRDHREHLHGSKGDKSRMGPTTCSKKRSSVPVRVSLSRCKYTRSITTVTGTKRKEIQSFVFDAHYHRPFKKYRILSSTAFIVSSVFQVSNSFGGSFPPQFVP